MTIEEAGISNDNLFKDCDSTYVFDQLRRGLESGGSRSLWRRIESEMRSGGVGAVETYLRSTFTEVVQRAKDSAIHFQESLKE